MNATLAFVKNPDAMLGTVGPDETLTIMMYPDWEVVGTCTKATLKDCLRSAAVNDIIEANEDALDYDDDDASLADALGAWTDLLAHPSRADTYLEDVPEQYDILLAWTAAPPAQEWACVVARLAGGNCEPEKAVAEV